MNANIRPLFIACLLALFATATSARAQYTFTLIADNSSPTFSVVQFSVPSLNSGGTAAFWAALAVGGSGIYTGAGGPITTITDYSGAFSGFGGDRQSINTAGTVAFLAGLDAGGTGIYTGAGGATTPIAETSSPTFSGFVEPSINSAGTAAFRADLDAGGTGIFSGAGGATTTIADSNGPDFSGFGNLPSINTAGVVAFLASLDAGGLGIFTGAGGATTTIANSGGPPFLFFGGGPAINAAGTVAFRATLDAGGQGIFTGAGGATTTIADSTGAFDTFSNPSINTAGAVVFLANLDAGGGSGIYLGNGGAGTEVIGTGDALFGSTVSTLAFGNQGLNDAGQVAFQYSLADGRIGIAVANPPDVVTGTPTLSAPLSNSVSGNPMSIGFTLPEAASNGTVKLSFTGPVATVATLVNAQGTVGAHAFSLPTDNLAASLQVASVSGPTALPDGVYTVTLQYQDALGNPSASATSTNVTVAVTPYAQWKAANLGDVNAPDAGNVDGDTYVNLAEYGLVLVPTAFSVGPVGEIFAYPEGSRLRIFFTRDPARNDVTIEVLAADDLAGPWTTIASSVLGAVTTGTGYYGGDSAGPGLKTVEARDLYNVDDPAHPNRFLKLQVSH